MLCRHRAGLLNAIREAREEGATADTEEERAMWACELREAQMELKKPVDRSEYLEEIRQQEEERWGAPRVLPWKTTASAQNERASGDVSAHDATS
jgi:hypothetical protein